MATKKPRITVTLEQDAYEALEMVAKVQGVSMSAVLADVWSEAVPVMTRVAKLILEAQAVKGGVGDRIREIATEAELAMMPMAREAVATLDLFEDSIRKAMSDAGAAAAAGGTRSATAGDGAVPKGRKGRAAK